MLVLSLLFLCTATVYSSVGFGGGSTYLAILMMWGISHQTVPQIALICNISVVAGNCWHYFQKNGNPMRFLWPFLIGSIPMSFLGGALEISKLSFQILLCLSLWASGLILIFQYPKVLQSVPIQSRPRWLAILVGGLLGLLSGIIGIGGGIFLSPFLLLTKWNTPQKITTSASLFIFINSIAGFLGQLHKGLPQEFWQFVPLLLAVILGGQLGNYLHLHQFRSKQIVQLTGILVLIVAIRLGYMVVAQLFLDPIF